jgi:threonine/homoserine/homoserine lactone efflux protein
MEDSVDLQLLVRGFILGLTIAAAVGPITLLVIRRTLGSGWLVGVASGLGVATADATYGAIAAFGISAASDLLVSLSRPLGFIGGIALLVIGARTVRDAHVPPVATPATTRGLARAYISILGLTLTNPLTIVLFAALVVSVGVPATTAAAASLWLGLALGSASWYVICVTAVAALRTRVSPRLLRGITVVSGVIIAIFGVLTLIGAIRG